MSTLSPSPPPARRGRWPGRGSAAALLLLVTLAGCVGQTRDEPEIEPGDPAAGLLTLPDGRSVVVYPDRLEHDGPARFRWPDGRIYEGDWQDGRPHGYGTDIRPGGERYSGDWDTGEREGQGELVLPDGSRYVGGFHKGLRHGDGRLEDDQGVYEGQWEHDLPHGTGDFHGSDGAHYSGDWYAGQRAGHGTFSGADGTRYQGDWAGDQPTGFGTLESTGGNRYSGHWQGGRRHGYGHSEGPPGLAYEGTWVDDQPQGYGRQQAPDGTRYEGEWLAGKRHGQGVEAQPDGSFHEGIWEYNQPLGAGLRRSASGIEISGLWNRDSVSTGLLKLPTGPTYAGPLFRNRNRVVAARLLEWLDSMATSGDPYAQLLLGTLYLDSIEPAPDRSTARRWLRQAADAGIAEARYRLGLDYERSNPQRAVTLLAEAARQDHAGANARLGDYYRLGQWVPADTGRAMHYYRQATEFGSLDARRQLAELLITLDQPAEAITLIEGVALHTGDWRFLTTLATARAANGEFALAARAQQFAIEAATGNGDPPSARALEALQAREQAYQRGRRP